VRPFIPLPELQELFNRSSLFVLPALNEPWGMVYLEAMACRTPVLGLKRGSLPELTRDGKLGFLLDRPDATMLADAIRRVLFGLSNLKTAKRCAGFFCANSIGGRRLSGS
jgi:glycosyltransferase involved in cell wall biosynthesis